MLMINYFLLDMYAELSNIFSFIAENLFSNFGDRGTPFTYPAEFQKQGNIYFNKKNFFHILSLFVIDLYMTDNNLITFYS